MSPQAKKKKSAAPSAAAVRKDTLSKLAAAYSGDDYVSAKVRQGLELENEKHALYERIAVNRRQLRDFAVAGDMAQADVDLIYPVKGAAGSEDASSATPENAG